MKSITDNTPLMATLLKYAQFWLAFNNLTVKIEALGKEEALKPEMVEALDTFQKIMKTWREAITQGGGHIGNVMIERPFEKNAVRFR